MSRNTGNDGVAASPTAPPADPESQAAQPTPPRRSGPRVRIADGESTVISTLVQRQNDADIDRAAYPESAVSKVVLVCFLFVRVMLSHTKALTGFVLFISAVTQANFLSMAPFGAYVLVHLAAYPRPSAAQWDFVIVYLIVVLLLKFAVQLPFFCMVGAGSTNTEWELRTSSFCGADYQPPTSIIEGAGI